MCAAPLYRGAAGRWTEQMRHPALYWMRRVAVRRHHTLLSRTEQLRTRIVFSFQQGVVAYFSGEATQSCVPVRHQQIGTRGPRAPPKEKYCPTRIIRPGSCSMRVAVTQRHDGRAADRVPQMRPRRHRGPHRGASLAGVDLEFGGGLKATAPPSPDTPPAHNKKAEPGDWS